jgi:hypothetical protein
MKKFWLIKIHPYFVGKDEKSGEHIILNNWRENVADIMAQDIEQAKQTAALTGIIEGDHYNDIIEETGFIN